MIDSKDYKTYRVYCVYGHDDSECEFNVKASSYEGAREVAFDILEARGLDRDEALELLELGHMDHHITIEEGEVEKPYWGRNYFSNPGRIH